MMLPTSWGFVDRGAGARMRDRDDERPQRPQMGRKESRKVMMVVGAMRARGNCRTILRVMGLVKVQGLMEYR